MYRTPFYCLSGYLCLSLCLCVYKDDTNFTPRVLYRALTHKTLSVAYSCSLSLYYYFYIYFTFNWHLPIVFAIKRNRPYHLCLSVCLTLSLSLCRALCISFCLSVSISASLSLSLSLCVSISATAGTVCPYNNRPPRLTVNTEIIDVQDPILLSLSIPVFLCVSVSVSLYLSLSL